jgi:hypothetical protein
MSDLPLPPAFHFLYSSPVSPCHSDRGFSTAFRTNTIPVIRAIIIIAVNIFILLFASGLFAALARFVFIVFAHVEIKLAG